MVEAGRIGALLDVQPVVHDGDQVVEHSRHNRRAAGRAENEAELAVPAYDRGTHAREWALAWGDGVVRPLDEPKAVRRAQLRGKVIHLVVHQKTEAGNSDAGAEGKVQRIGHGDGVAVRVHH